MKSHHTLPPLNRRAFAQTALLLGTSVVGASMAFNAFAQPASKLAARALPTELNALSAPEPWSLMGSATLRYFGFKVYDSHLWLGAASTNPLLSKTPFALEIVYAVSIKADEIVKVSLEEMARLRPLSEAQIKAWTADLRKALTDVKSGDKLTGVYVPQQGTRFFFNSRPTSEINDPDFGDAFFAIWLDAKTKRLDLRSALLGQNPVR